MVTTLDPIDVTETTDWPPRCPECNEKGHEEPKVYPGQASYSCATPGCDNEGWVYYNHPGPNPGF